MVASRSDLSRQGFELGADLFDRVEVGRVFRQEDEARADASDRPSHGLSLVGAEVVQDHDVTWLEGGREELFDIGAEAFAVDRPVEQAGRFDAVVAQRGEEGRGLPPAMRNLVDRRSPFGAQPRRRVMLVFVQGVTTIRRKKRLIIEVSALTPRSDKRRSQSA